MSYSDLLSCSYWTCCVFSVSGSSDPRCVPAVQTGQHVPAGGDPAGEPGARVLRGAVQLRGGPRVLRGQRQDGQTLPNNDHNYQ